MKLSQEQIEHMARLARIELLEEEKEKFQKQLSAVLEYMEILNEIDTEKVEPTSQVTGLKNVFREDIVRACDEETRKLILENFPERDGRLLRVPAVFQ